MKNAIKTCLYGTASLACAGGAWAAPKAGMDGAAHHEGAEHDAGLPQLDPEWFASQIFWLVATFLFLYLVFSKKILPELSNIIETRRENIQNDLDTAHELKEEAEKVQAAYEEALNEARERSSALFTQVEQDIKDKSAEKLNKFRNHANEQIQKAERKIQKSTQDAMDDMNSIAAEIASEAAKKIVGISTDIDKAKSVVQSLNKKAA